MPRRMNKEWPALGTTAYLGKRISRLDGPAKSSGAAKYTYDVNRPGMLYAKFVLCPHAHARVRGIDAAAAQAMPGVVVARAIAEDGYEVTYAGAEVAVVAAETEEQARAAARAVAVDYEVLPHNVLDDPPDAIADEWKNPSRTRDEGDVDGAFAGADLVVDGEHGAPIITHCCLEAHGSVAEFPDDEHLNVWISTQNVSGVGNDYQSVTGVDAANIRVDCQYMGGGFGSKFGLDVWDLEATRIAEETGRPVKAMIERDHELIVAGSRPSAYAKVRVAVKRDGTVVGWQSECWGSGGMRNHGNPNLPYIFKGIPARRTSTIGIATNTSPHRAWRAPNHPQSCLITMGALDDAAAALGMDPLAFFKKNLAYTDRAELYAEQLDIAAGLLQWPEKWKKASARTGVVRSGVGLALHTWGGGGHPSECEVRIHPDGSVEASIGTQDLGTGSRTVVAIVAAETLGVPLEAVKVHIGDNKLPPSGPSGGSTTVGGISSSTRTAAVDAANQLFAKVAPELGAGADALVAKDGRVSAADKSMSWHEACRLLGTAPVIGRGRTDRDLMDQGVGGVQMAEVKVDMETGVVDLVKIVAVQDCGTIIDLKTAESQVYGGCIMGITSALYEERVMDPVTGCVLNPDLEFYRLAGLEDCGEIVVHMMQDEKNHARGVIGLGEPPVISPMAAIANAVANAAGVRVARLPLTPRNVLAALGKGAV